MSEWGKWIPLKENFCNHSQYMKKLQKWYLELKKGNEETNERKPERTELQTEKKKTTNQTNKQTTKHKRWNDVATAASK